MMTPEDREILKLIRQLLEKDEQTVPPATNVTADARLTHLRQASATAQGAANMVGQLQRKIAQLQEQIQSQMQMIEMTLSYVETEPHQGLHTLNAPLTETPKNQGFASYLEVLEKEVLMDGNPLQDYFPNSFLLNRPLKDSVAGFITTHDQNKIFYLVSIAQSQKGAKSALLSVIVKQILTELFEQRRYDNVGSVIEYVDQKLSRWFGNEADLGVQIGVCTVDWLEATLSFSGLQSSLFVVEAGQVEEIKGLDAAFGSLQNQKPKKQVISLKKGMQFYWLSQPSLGAFAADLEKRITFLAELKKLMQQGQTWRLAQRQQAFEQSLQEWKKRQPPTENLFLISFEI
jgi:hypothetical protein